MISHKQLLDRIYKRGGINEAEYNELMWRLNQHMPEKKVIKKEVDLNQVEKVAKSVIKKNKKETDEGAEWNKKALHHIIRIASCKLININNPKQVDEALRTYFLACEADEMKPTIAGMVVILGAKNRLELLAWAHGEIRVASMEVIRFYLNMLEAYDEMSAKDGKISSVYAMFHAKNNYGYRDQVDINTNGDRELTDAEIEEKYRSMHEVVELDLTDDENKT